MKTAPFLLLAAFTLCMPARGQMLLNTGESYIFNFSTLPLHNTTGYVFLGGTAAFSLDPTSLSPGYEMQFDVFENNISETPLFSSIRSASDAFVGADLPGAWQDHQGVVRFTMLSGTATLDTIYVTAFTPMQNGGSDAYFETYVPVPEPSILALSIACLVSICLWIVRRRFVRDLF